MRDFATEASVAIRVRLTVSLVTLAEVPILI